MSNLDSAFLIDHVDELRLALEARRLRQSFGAFVAAAWPHATGFDFVDGRHIDILVRHMEGVAKGDIPRLLINVPPATLKSTIVSVLFPCWVWTFDPTADFLCFSYSAAIGLDFSTRCRELLRSDWYQSLFPGVQIADDDDQKAYYRLSAGGWRRTSTIGGLATGSHPKFIIIDDPISRDEVNSFALREQLRQWYFETLSTRGIAKHSAHVVVQQRLHVDDLSGAIVQHSRQLERDHGSSPWRHVMLPMRYDPSRAMPDLGYGGDWRTEPGELLYKELLSEHVVVTTERALGLSATEAQLQQNPSRRDGGTFDVSKLKTIDAKELPTAFNSIVRAWDLAASEDRGCFTVGLMMGLVKKTDRYTGEESAKFYVIDVVRKQTSNPVELMHQTARLDKYGFPDCRTVFESQPAAAGMLVSKSIIQRLRGFNVRDVRPMGSKEIRAEPFGTAIRFGEVLAVDSKWLPAFLDELETFPSGKYSDQVDAASLAYGELIAGKSSNRTVIANAPTPIPGDDERCSNPDCRRPAFEPSGYCCTGCEQDHSSPDKHVKCTPHCCQKFNDFYMSRMSHEIDRPSWSRRR